MTDTLPPWALEKAREWAKGWTLSVSGVDTLLAKILTLDSYVRLVASLAALLVEAVGDRVVSLVTERDEAEAKLAEAQAEIELLRKGEPDDRLYAITVIMAHHRDLEAKLAEAQGEIRALREGEDNLIAGGVELQGQLKQAEARVAKLREAGNNLAKPADRLQRYCEKGNTICFDNDSDAADAERYAAYLAAWDAALAASPVPEEVKP